jgi:hypothetical protein
MAVTRSVATKQITSTQKALGIQELRQSVDKGLLGQLLGGATGSSTGSTGGGSTTPPPSTATGQATVPTGPSANLQALLAAIPIAMDAQVITADHHNSLRSAVIAMANQLGLGLTSPTTAYSFAPSILELTGAPANWSVNTSFAAVSAAGANPDGWLPVQLPDGQNIQSMTVTGKLTTPAPTTFTVTLIRETIVTDANNPPAPLITLDLHTQSGTFNVSGSIVPAGAASASGLVAQLALVQDLKLIDTTNYKYFMRATVTGAQPATVAEIDTIQIVVGS